MKQISRYKYSLLALLFAALTWASFDVFDASYVAKWQIEHFQQKLDKKEQKVNRIARFVFRHSPDSISRYFRYVKQRGLFQDQGIAFFIYKNGKPVFWNTNQVMVSENIPEEGSFSPLHSTNGYYLAKRYSKGNIDVVGYILIKHQFQHNNKYLKNGYFQDWGLNQNIEIDEKPNKNDVSIKNLSNKTVFLLNYSNFSSPFFQHLRALLFFLTLIFILFAFRRFLFETVIRNQLLAFFVFSIIVLAGRWIMVNNLFPNNFYQLPLFSSILYAQASIQPSLGDFLINVLLLFYLIYIFFSYVKFELPAKKLYRQIITVFLIAVLVVAAQFIAWLVQGLVVNSKIDFNLSNYLQLSVYGYLALFIVALMLLGFVLLADKILSIIKQNNFSFWGEVVYLTVITIAFYFIGWLFFANSELLFTFWCLPVLITMAFVRHRGKRLYSLGEIAILLVLFSGFTALSLSKWTNVKTDKNKREIAQKISNDRDPIAEFVFSSIEKKMKSNNYLKSKIGQYWANKKKIDNYIVKRYFNGFWSKYNIRITICLPTDSMYVNPGKVLVDCRQYFMKQIESGTQTATPSLYFVNNSRFSPIYVADVPLSYVGKSKADTLKTAFIEFYPKYLNHAKGYPELLLSKKELSGIAMSGKYTYAKYKRGELVSYYGGFNYPVSSKIFNRKQSLGSFYYIDFQNFHHLVYKTDGGMVVISSPQDDAMVFATMFSNIFALLSVFLFVVVLVFGWNSGLNIARMFNNFNSKLQLFMLSIIFFAILLFGIGTAIYINGQYKNKNDEAISKRTSSILVDLSNQLGDLQSLPDSLNNYITYQLVKLSNIFYTDINLYNAKGELIATSRPEIFNIGLLNDKMNSRAYKQLQFLNKTEYIHKEQIGDLHYLAAYIPFYNQNGKFLAYLNVPYFGRQNVLEKEISSFLAALINIYVFLFLLSITIAFVFANFLSKPLRLIKERIAGIQIGKTNELIEWDADDEIGALVKEYNRMVIQLQKNIELLAKTERETAWREMAKQVAHEIKNPLTPMKLSIQHLKRSYDAKDPKMEERVKKTADTLIQEIDILARIATEFSNFAKMPKAEKQKLQLVPLLQQSFDLYRETEGIDFSFDVDEKRDLQVFVDREQILRVFNNLIKNAIQAVEEVKNPKIELKLVVKGNSALISVKDNGVGISENQKEQIFVPNFTTKSAGMGLGLAMAKNIVEQSEGEIWFESEVGKGTTFYVKLRLA